MIPYEQLQRIRHQMRARHRAAGQFSSTEIGLPDSPRDFDYVWSSPRAYWIALAKRPRCECGRMVPRARACYAIPTCYVCLPRPEPLPVLYYMARSANYVQPEGAYRVVFGHEYCLPPMKLGELRR